MSGDPEEIERASAAMLAALSEAQGLALRGRIDAELRGLLRHARELHDIIVDGLAPEASELALFITRIGVKIAELEALARSGDQELH